MTDAGYWHNFTTDEADYRTSPPTTDEEALQYLPQSAPARHLYELQRSQGDSVLDAMEVVLRAAVGES